MKLIYAVSERGIPKRPAARYLDAGTDIPACGGNVREPLVRVPEEAEPTCKIFMDLAMMGNSPGQKAALESYTPLTPR